MFTRFSLTAVLLSVVSSQRTHAEFHLGGPAHAGEEIHCHFPVREHLRNQPGSDGLGLCVFVSIDSAARWSNEPALIGFREFMRKHPGGGWPEKVERMLPKMAETKGLPVPPYVQHFGADVEFLRRAVRGGRMVCVTYDGRDGVLYRGSIAHMVNLVHFSDRWAVILDNNAPGQWLWMSPDEFIERWRGAGGWAWTLLKSGPPPIPVSADRFGRSERLPAIGRFNDFGPLPVPGWESPLGFNFGLGLGDSARFPPYRLNGKNVNREEALSALGDPVRDAQRMHLTIIGPDDRRLRIRKELESHPRFAELHGTVRVHDYRPDHWAVADVGFAEGITLQQPAQANGTARVLFRFRQYPGADPLITAIRKADPKYQPDRDPDPARPDPPKRDRESAPVPTPAPSPSIPTIPVPPAPTPLIPVPAVPPPHTPEPIVPAPGPTPFAPTAPPSWIWTIVGALLGRSLLKRREL